MQTDPTPSADPAIRSAIESLVRLERDDMIAHDHVDALIQSLAGAIVEHALGKGLAAACESRTP